MKQVTSAKRLQELLDEGRELYVRWSRGPAKDRRQGRSFDYLNGGAHAGLSAVRVERDWLHDPDYLVRRTSEYRFLRMKDHLIRPYLVEGRQIGTDSDGYESIELTGECWRLAGAIVKM